MELLKIKSSENEPTLIRGDVAVVVPVKKYDKPGIYVLDINGRYEFIRAIKKGAGILCNKDNEASYEMLLSHEGFNLFVYGKVCRVIHTIDASIQEAERDLALLFNEKKELISTIRMLTAQLKRKE